MMMVIKVTANPNLTNMYDRLPSVTIAHRNVRIPVTPQIINISFANNLSFNKTFKAFMIFPYLSNQSYMYIITD